MALSSRTGFAGTPGAREAYTFEWEIRSINAKGFDLRLRLDPANPDATEPDELGAFLKHTVNSRPGLQAYILKWDMAMLFTLSRQIVPVLALDLMTQRRIHFRLDAQHPSGAAHHQKVAQVGRGHFAA